MKKLICLLFLVVWAYRNPAHFIEFWGYVCGTGMFLAKEIFALALVTFEQSR